MQNRKFIVNLAILIILNLLIKPFWILIIDPGVQYQVGNANYGEYSALFNFSFLLTIFLDFGLTNFNNKNIAQNSHLLSKHFSSLLTLKFALGIFYVCLTMLCAVIVGYDERYMKLLIILAINQFLISFILYLRSNLQGLHLFKTDSVVSILDRLIMIILCVALFWQLFGLKVDIMNYVYAQTIGYSLTAIITFWIVLRETHTFKLKWDWRFSLMMLKKSFPFAILVLLMTFYNRLDSVMIERLLPPGIGASEAGIYAKGFRLLEAAGMIGFLFATQLLPIFSRMIENKEDIQHLVKLSFTLIATPAIIVSLGCAFYSEYLCKLINKSTDSSHVFSLLMLCFTASSVSYIFGTLLTANGNLKQLNIMAVCGIAVNLLLNFILIPEFYALGSAVASVFTQFFTAIIQVLIVHRVFKFKVNKRLLIALLFFIFGVALINYLTLHLTNNWYLNFSLMAIASGAWAFVTGMLSIKSVLRFIKYN
jgi:O-antigen/teichoic acid export membrane protein